ncbi:hypothetical protein UA08_02375 [Talaromyces atroroseus]|uniref:Uncharacterized protein n=1 Tax=Talaromyces atroroseus TaxID=1441469 RepID=A0A225B6U9_TALAT|nr:hypothetical protein UA08_02375 [Talaromyces atroroseus]OKL62595.1 hypothetical protein UA08_02375 [Talaromyces atroroseus]
MDRESIEVDLERYLLASCFDETFVMFAFRFFWSYDCMRDMRLWMTDLFLLSNSLQMSEAEDLDKRTVLQSFSKRIHSWPEEDWPGISDSKQRKKIQNRLNQRVQQNVHIFETDSQVTKRLMHNFEAIACHQYMLGSPRTDVLLSLSQSNSTSYDDPISPSNTAGPSQYGF